MNSAVWHDVECGGYREDLAVWLELAREYGDPVLDIGAGTGRVTLALARAGHRVVALDRDRELLDELARRAYGLPIDVVAADARAFSLDQRPFALVIVPMQTIQLFGGPVGRGAFLACARRHLAPGGVLAAAITERFEEFEVLDGEPGPLPDMAEYDGAVYSSSPTAVRRAGAAFVLERRRELVGRDGSRTVSYDRVALDTLSRLRLAREAGAAGLSRRIGLRRIPATAEHIGSQVVILGD